METLEIKLLFLICSLFLLWALFFAWPVAESGQISAHVSDAGKLTQYHAASPILVKGDEAQIPQQLLNQLSTKS